MNAKIRNRIFYLFIFIFIVVTIFTSIYASGYRFNFTWPFSYENILIKTGILQIKTEPRDAKIYLEKTHKNIFSNPEKLNGKITTPNKIKNLLPGEYKLKLELPGYWSWEKTIYIHPQKSLYLDNISLFKKTLPLNIYQSETQEILASNNNEYVYLVKDKNIINLKKETLIKLPDINTTSTKWSNDDKKLITNSYIFNLKQNSIFNLKPHINNSCKNIKSYNNGQKIACQENGTIKLYNIETQEKKTLIKTNNKIQDFIIKNDKLNYIVNNENSSQIIIHNLNNNEEEKMNLPLGNNYKFINTNNKYLNILETKHEILYLINTDSKYIKEIAKISNFKEGIWISDNQIIYKNDIELFMYDLRLNESELITRVSEKINKILWHEKEQYIIYSTNSSLYIIDWINRKYTITKILSLETIKSPFLNSSNDTVYFLSKIGQQSGLYKLSIQ